ncbi:hypothetical protein ACQU0X_22280 [Pseudovibrio ascidiaceicola]|uniref:hypothetical protein n=1 Tax=Pseudovibrio ascidiaceicola TaxID=285279 RepID=UPI003D36D002
MGEVVFFSVLLLIAVIWHLVSSQSNSEDDTQPNDGNLTPIIGQELLVEYRNQRGEISDLNIRIDKIYLKKDENSIRRRYLNATWHDSFFSDDEQKSITLRVDRILSIYNGEAGLHEEGKAARDWIISKSK